MDSIYRGTAVWSKTLFILSKIDLIQITADGRERKEREQYYELGRLFGKSFHYLECPTFDQCIAIGLPEHQTHNGPPFTGDLQLLKQKLVGKDSQAPYVHRLEEAIQSMCTDLKEAIKSSWSKYALIQWVSDDGQAVELLYKNSKERAKVSK